MLNVQPLTTIDLPNLKNLIRGYVSSEKYQVSWQESDKQVSFILELVPLAQPYRKAFDLDELEDYQELVEAGFSLAAYEHDEMIALALCTPQEWNQSLWIHEFHVLERYQGKGIGRLLMEAVAAKAQAANLRSMFCETQNTNVPAIRFYRKLGFQMDALNLSLYSNNDYPDGEIALFMKRHL